MTPTSNTLLDSLPDGERSTVYAMLHRTALVRGAVLFEPRTRLEYVYFPIDMVVSLTSQTSEGDPIGVSMVGSEGAAGCWLSTGVGIAPWYGVAQVGGSAWRVPTSELAEVLPQLPVLTGRFQRYLLTQTFLMSQSILCNRFHELTQRTARWLLIMDSRAKTVPLPVTQEFLSQMLGVHRPSVTLALQALAEASLIRSEGRGLIRIVDRDALDAAACECFQRVAEFNRTVTGSEDASFIRADSPSE